MVRELVLSPQFNNLNWIKRYLQIGITIGEVQNENNTSSGSDYL